jgi:DNA polymerase-3 subunit delta
LSILKQTELAGIPIRRLSELAGLLLHGSEQHDVMMAAQSVVRKVIGSADDPFLSVRMTADTAIRESGRLQTEFESLSLLGGRRVVVVTDCGETMLGEIDGLLSGSSQGNLIVLTSTALGKSSRLRRSVEESTNFAAVALYPPTAAELESLTSRQLREHGMEFEGGAYFVFESLVGLDAALALGEVEKLALYCHGAAVVRESDVRSCCGDSAGFDVGEVIDAALTGDGAAVDRGCAALGLQGDMRGVLSIFSAHLGRLEALRMEMARGVSADQALRGARPPVHFSKRAAVQSELRSWDLEGLQRLRRSIAATTLQCRNFPQLEHALVGRLLLAVAREARGLRSVRS